MKTIKELKSSTLKHYIDRSTIDLGHHKEMSALGKMQDIYDPEHAPDKSEIEKHDKDALKRRIGIMRASAKLAGKARMAEEYGESSENEEETYDEIGKDDDYKGHKKPKGKTSIAKLHDKVNK